MAEVRSVATSSGSVSEPRTAVTCIDLQVLQTPATLLARADYNLTTFEVHRLIALESIRSYHNLEILCYASRIPNVDEAHPSWIPRWNDTNETSTAYSLLAFLYNAASGRPPQTRFNAVNNSLTAQGLFLGTIVETNTHLRLEDVSVAREGNTTRNRVRESLRELSRILVHDRWQEETGIENAAGRVSNNADAHFADFAAYLLPLLEANKHDSYVSLVSKWCSSCEKFMSTQRRPTPVPPAVGFRCPICDDGEFDLCQSCYKAGKWCKDEKHTLKEVTAPTLWCPYTYEVLQELRLQADFGDGDRFYEAARRACRGRVFMRTSRGWRGLVSMDVEAGDTLVVLFGSRVPFILRRSGDAYRLVGDCYGHGIMDGEAMHMLADGNLAVEEFNIR
jgi:hypothetical protein